ncbi:MAG TPA: nucleoside phosphorylase [Candidatus Nanoarchaeia archaeon]|nr:nucleoside phosphorylase [Candidatus Nanoarchaeia archaeon]
MTFPNFKGKHAEDSMFSPSDFLKYYKSIGKYPDYAVPEGMIICYQKSLMEYIISNHKVTKVKGITSVGEMYLLDDTNKKIAVIGRFGIGSPVAVTLVEEFIAFGVKKFITIGTAGTLQKNIKIGDLMVCERAIRDEGTSHHYLKPSKYSYASEEMTSKIKKSLEKLKKKYFVGTTWTVDAPYRETVSEAKHYQKEGVSTVEMEASALFAVAEYRKVELGAIFTISDSLADLEWKPSFHHNKTQEGLETIYKVAVDSLLS